MKVTSRHLFKLRTISINILLAAFWYSFLHANILAAVQDRKLITGVTAIYGTVIILFVLIRYDPRSVSKDPLDWGVAIDASFLSFWLRPTGDADNLFGSYLSLVGFCLTFAGFLSLGRHYGIVPADRGVASKGLYSFVRHPIYASYFLSFAGYVINNPSLLNIVVVVSVFCLEFYRLHREEMFLFKVSPEYREYAKKVSWRLVPHVY